MNKIKIIHTADLHIGAPLSFLSSLADTRRYETLKTFESITNMCQKEETEFLLIAGDLFDCNCVDAPLIDGVFAAIKNIPDTKVIFAAGNHDPLTADSPFLNRTLPENLYVLPPSYSVIEFENCRIYGASFDSVYCEGVPVFPLSPIKDEKVNIMVIHGETRADFGGNYRPITPEFVKKSGMDYIALGHIHKRSEINSVGTTFIAYSGCPEGQGFDEKGEKGVYMGTVSKGQTSLTFVPTASRKILWYDIDITDKDPLSEIKKTIKEDSSHHKNLYRITLKGKRESEKGIDIPALTAGLSNLTYFIKIKDKTVTGANLESLKEENTLKGIFVRKMLKRIEEAESKEKQVLEKALDIGLKAFNEEVVFDED